MFFSIIFTIIFYFCIFIIFAGVFLYPLITEKTRKKEIKRNKEIPAITILIPVYNEEKVIAQKIENTFSLDYPENKKEIVVIDNGSADKTSEIIKNFPVTLLKSDRGKIKALNKGIDYSKTDIIVMTDADVKLSRESVKNLVSCLNEKVGAVNGYVIPKAAIKSSLMREKENYKKKDWDLRFKEGLIDSVCNLDGKLIAFKKSVLPKIPDNAPTDDYTITFLIRKKGYRLLVDRKAEVYEALQESFYNEIKQFRRYAGDVIATNFRNINFLFNPKYGYFGLMTFPFRRFFPVLYPFFLIYILIYLFYISPYISLFLFLAGLLFLIFFKKLIIAQLIAVILSYFDIFLKNNLKGGEWEKSR